MEPINVKTLTADGLVLKRSELIEALDAPEASRAVVEIGSWQISRMVRREFYLMSMQLFHMQRRWRHRVPIKEMLADLNEEADRLTDIARPLPRPTDTEYSSLDLRLVCADAETLLETLLVSDRAVVKLVKEHGSPAVSETLIPFNAAMTTLKSYLLTRHGSPKKTEPDGNLIETEAVSHIVFPID